MLIPGYEQGSDITLLNTAYIGRKRDEEGKFKKDFISILFKDNTTGEKHNHIIYEPQYTYYKLNDMYKLDHNLFFIEKDRVEPITVKYSDVLKDIASKTNNTEFFYDNIRNRNSGENRKLHTINEVFMSDINIEDYYRMLFAREYQNNPIKLNVSYLDIEVDGKNQMGDFPEPGECPINAVSFLDERTDTNYQFLLEEPSNPLIEQYKELLKQPDTIPNLKKFIIKSVGGYKKAVKFGLDKTDYKFLFFKDELELLHVLFQLIHQLSPDVLEIWNMAFDLDYIMARIERLGADPKDIICDPRIKEQFLRFYVDERNRNEFAERGDYVSISQFTIWLDDMIQFASRRKGRGQFSSFKLDDIGSAVAKVNKLDYSHITTNITMLPYLNYLVFSWYNLMDTTVQKCIERSTNDVDYIYTKCLINNTRFSKGHRQSVYLANRFTKDFYDYGYIIGNNTNLWNEKPETKYPGAMVGNPLHNSEYAVIFINGRPTLLAGNVVDYDYKSLYPSIAIENNMAPNTQVGKIEIAMQISYNEHPDMYSNNDEPDGEAKYSRGGEFLENMMSGNHLEFCKRWLHLGDFKDVINDMGEYFDGQNHVASAPMNLDPNDVIYFAKPETEAIQFMETEYSPSTRDALYFYKKLDGKDELIESVTKGAFV